MKRISLPLLLSGSLLLAVQPGYSAESPPSAAPPPVPEQAARQQITGMGVGTLIGTLLAGPAGAVAGAAFGNMAGWSQGMEESWRDERQLRLDSEASGALSELRLQRSRQRLTSQQAQLGTLQQQLRQKPALSALLQSLTLDFHFQTNSAVVEPHYYPRLQQLAHQLARLPHLHLQLTGYADPRGDSGYNRRLSARRVEALTSVLMREGLGKSRICPEVRGESQALSSTTPGLQPFDRKVEMRFLLNPESPTTTSTRSIL